MPDLKLHPREFREESCIDNCPERNMGTLSARGVVNTDEPIFIANRICCAFPKEMWSNELFWQLGAPVYLPTLLSFL